MHLFIQPGLHWRLGDGVPSTVLGKNWWAKQIKDPTSYNLQFSGMTVISHTSTCTTNRMCDSKRKQVPGRQVTACHESSCIPCLSWRGHGCRIHRCGLSLAQSYAYGGDQYIFCWGHICIYFWHISAGHFLYGTGLNTVHSRHSNPQVLISTHCHFVLFAVVSMTTVHGSSFSKPILFSVPAWQHVTSRYPSTMVKSILYFIAEVLRYTLILCCSHHHTSMGPLP